MGSNLLAFGYDTEIIQLVKNGFCLSTSQHIPVTLEAGGRLTQSTNTQKLPSAFNLPKNMYFHICELTVLCLTLATTEFLKQQKKK